MSLMSKQPWLMRAEDALLDLLEFCDTPDHQALVASLLADTAHLTELSFSDAIRSLGHQIETDWGLQPNETWFVSSNNKQNTDSSQEVLNRLKAFPWKNPAWNSKQFLTRYRDVAANIKTANNIVIVDDFIGTGNSMAKTIKWFQEYSATNDIKINIYVCVVAGCAKGLEAVQAQGAVLGHVVSTDRAISDRLTGQALSDALKNMDELETKLGKIVGTPSFADYSFGYGKSEAMYYRDGGNTPNNVFPIFWWKKLRTGLRRTVMHRT